MVFCKVSIRFILLVVVNYGWDSEITEHDSEVSVRFQELFCQWTKLLSDK